MAKRLKNNNLKKASKQSHKGQVKKRKVGRPKKRGRPRKRKNKPKPKAEGVFPKKRRYKKSKQSDKIKNRGFATSGYNRIRKLIWLNFKSDFTSYRQFISNTVDENGNSIHGTNVSSRIYAKCKSIDENCTDEQILNIYELERKQKEEKYPKPMTMQITWETEFPFWSLHTDHNMFRFFDKRVWINAPMILREPFSFQAVNAFESIEEVNENGEIIIKHPVKDRFLDFIRHCNNVVAADPELENDPYPPNVVFGYEGEQGEIIKDIRWNEKTQRWETDLLIIGLDGGIYNWGYNPYDSESVIIEDLILTPDEKEKLSKAKEDRKVKAKDDKEKEETTQTDKDIEKVKAEKELQEAITRANEALARANESLAKLKEVEVEQKRIDLVSKYADKLEKGEISIEQFIAITNAINKK